jgi:Flp pilus assembly protein TadD/SAM-dependent methyltransferase
MNRKERRAARKLGTNGSRHPAVAGAADAIVGDVFRRAVLLHQAGRLEEAEREYNAALAIAPAHAGSLHYLGVIAHQRGQHEAAVELIGKAVAADGRDAQAYYHLGLASFALRRIEDAITHNRRAIALDPKHLGAHQNLAAALIEQGRWQEAEAACRRMLELDFRNAAAHNNLGRALEGAGKSAEAAESYASALAVKPDFYEALVNRGRALLDLGQAGEALASLLRAMAQRDGEEVRRAIVACLRSGKPIPASDANRALVLRVLTEGWTTPDELVGIAEAFIRVGPAGRWIERAIAAWPTRLPAREWLGASGLGEIAEDRLLVALLATVWVGSVEMERFLSAVRAAILELAAGDARDLAHAAVLELACALARQCFINEYVWSLTEDETRRAQMLRDRLAAALAASDEVVPAVLAAAAAYSPLGALPGAERLLDRPWSDAVAALLTQQVREPREEQALRVALPRLTPIADEVSRRVQQQYEENPYPRWVRLGRAPQPKPLDALLRELFPRAPLRPLGYDQVDFLVAGCGTGQHPLERARQLAGVRILAIDLSAASLAYALRKTRELGVAGIEYAQADILQLGALERRFDAIETSGVLVAIADPFAAWRVLLALLKPGGLMSVGLYSETARRNIVRAQKFLAANGYGGDPDGIRRGRQAIMDLPVDDPVRAVLAVGDFYSASNCRDLLFHVQETRFTIPQIAAFLAQHRLTFLGFALDPAVRRAYRARFPDDPAETNLGHWHQFEQEHPDTFISMYQFWVQKPG